MTWVIEAIEREAMARARLELLAEQMENPGFKLCGMTIKQIRLLRIKWLQENPDKGVEDIGK